MLLRDSWYQGAVETIAAVIARSQIVLGDQAKAPSRLPASFDAKDIAILEWIAEEGRRLGRRFVRM